MCSSYISSIPLTLHRVSTILSALAGDRNECEGSSLPLAACKVFRAYCATVPMPRPAASEPNENMRPMRDDGTTRALEFLLN